MSNQQQLANLKSDLRSHLADAQNYHDLWADAIRSFDLAKALKFKHLGDSEKVAVRFTRIAINNWSTQS